MPRKPRTLKKTKVEFLPEELCFLSGDTSLCNRWEMLGVDDLRAGRPCMRSKRTVAELQAAWRELGRQPFKWSNGTAGQRPQP